jgi:hypothetical protein
MIAQAFILEISEPAASDTSFRSAAENRTF